MTAVRVAQHHRVRSHAQASERGHETPFELGGIRRIEQHAIAIAA